MKTLYCAYVLKWLNARSYDKPFRLRFTILLESSFDINNQSFTILWSLASKIFNFKTSFSSVFPHISFWSYLPWNPVVTRLLRTVIVLSRYYLELGSVLVDQVPFQGQISSKASFLNWPVIILSYSSHYLSIFSRSQILVCVRTVPKMITINLKCYFVQIIVSISHLSIHSWFTQ